jgi:hypothetical protein
MTAKMPWKVSAEYHKLFPELLVGPMCSGKFYSKLNWEQNISGMVGIQNYGNFALFTLMPK